MFVTIIALSCGQFFNGFVTFSPCTIGSIGQVLIVNKIIIYYFIGFFGWYINNINGLVNLFLFIFHVCLEYVVAVKLFNCTRQKITCNVIFSLNTFFYYKSKIIALLIYTYKQIFLLKFHQQCNILFSQYMFLSTFFLYFTITSRLDHIKSHYRKNLLNHAQSSKGFS